MTKFERAIHLRFHFAGSTESSDEPYEPKMYVRSNWTPPHWTRPPVVLDKRLENFSKQLNKLFKKRIGKTNLLSYQSHALKTLQQQQDFLICPCDKNLGPAIIERDDYIKIAMRDHLQDGRTYRPLSDADCSNHKQRLENEIKSWMKKYHRNITKMERAFLKQGQKTIKNHSLVFILLSKPINLNLGRT